MRNYTITLRQTKYQYTSWPYGECRDYSVDSLSRIQCYRMCLTQQYLLKWKCVPLFTDNAITDYDITNETKFCWYESDKMFDYRRSETIFIDKCWKLCPKDCYDVEYHTRIVEMKNRVDDISWNDIMLKKKIPVERTIMWDSNELMFAYIEEPVMTFTQYLVFCGGLMGLLFGQSVKDLFLLIIEMEFWKIIFNKIIKILSYIKK